MSSVIHEYTPVNRRLYLEKFGKQWGSDAPERPIDVMGYPICEMARQAGSSCIFSYATTGISAGRISRFRPDVPIIAITNRKDTARELVLLYNVYPVLVKGELPRDPKGFVSFLREIADELHVRKSEFFVGTQELTKVVDPLAEDIKARGVIVFKAV